MSYKCSMCDKDAEFVERHTYDGDEESFLLALYMSEYAFCDFTTCSDCIDQYMVSRMSSSGTFLQPIDDYLAFYAMVKL